LVIERAAGLAACSYLVVMGEKFTRPVAPAHQSALQRGAAFTPEIIHGT